MGDKMFAKIEEKGCDSGVGEPFLEIENVRQFGRERRRRCVRCR